MQFLKMLLPWSGHSHKKQKDSLETRAEAATRGVL